MSNLNFYELIKNRRSIRSYNSSKSVPQEVLHRILEAGRMAPTAGNKQPGRFIVVREKTLLAKIYASYERDWLQQAQAVLIITGKKDNAWVRAEDGFNSLEIDLSIMMDHMILAAEFEGVATCWIIAFKQKILRAALNLGDDETVLCMTPLGYVPDGYQKRDMPQRKSLDELTTWY